MSTLFWQDKRVLVTGGSGFWRQMGGHLIRQLLHLRPHRVAGRGRATDDVAVHVPAPAQRGQQGVVDPGDRVPEVALQDAVQLNTLAGGQPQDQILAELLQPLRRPGVDHPVAADGLQQQLGTNGELHALEPSSTRVSGPSRAARTPARST